MQFYSQKTKKLAHIIVGFLIIGGFTMSGQTAIFPLDIMHITQDENGSYSHQGKLAMDFVGTTDQYPYSAPFDCELILKDSSWAGMVWKSTGKVLCADGQERNIILRAIHECSPSFSVGKILSKGDYMGKTGVCGNVTGDHVHFDAFEGTSYTTDPGKAIHLYDLFLVPESVNIVQDMGHNWIRTEEDIGSGGDYPLVCENNYLTREQMKGNAMYIADYFQDRGWTKNAIAGMLGNMERESTMSPCLWEGLDQGNMSVGFGLVQWTPASLMHDFANDLGEEPTNIGTQLDRIMYEKNEGLEWYTSNDGFPHALPETWEEWSKSTKSPEYLAEVFMENYERPHRDYLFLQERKDNAMYWFNADIWDKTPGEEIDTYKPWFMLRQTNMRRMGVRGRAR